MDLHPQRVPLPLKLTHLTDVVGLSSPATTRGRPTLVSPTAVVLRPRVPGGSWGRRRARERPTTRNGASGLATGRSEGVKSLTVASSSVTPASRVSSLPVTGPEGDGWSSGPVDPYPVPGGSQVSVGKSRPDRFDRHSDPTRGPTGHVSELNGRPWRGW